MNTFQLIGGPMHTPSPSLRSNAFVCRRPLTPRAEIHFASEDLHHALRVEVRFPQVTQPLIQPSSLR